MTFIEELMALDVFPYPMEKRCAGKADQVAFIG
jgi:hypothetical protein